MAALTWVCMVFMILQSHPGISSAHRVPPAPLGTADKPNNLGGKWEWRGAFGSRYGWGSGQAGGGGFQIGGGLPGLRWGIIHGNNGNPFFAGGASSVGGGEDRPDYGGLGSSSTSGTSGDAPGGGVGGSGGSDGGGGWGCSGGSGSISGGFFIPGLGYGSFGAPLFCVPPIGCYYGQYGSSGYGATDDHGNYGGYGSTTDDHGPYTPVSSNLADDRKIYGKALSSKKMKRPNHGANGHNAAREHYGKALSSRKMKRPNHGANGHNAAREHGSEPIASAMAPESD